MATQPRAARRGSSSRTTARRAASSWPSVWHRRRVDGRLTYPDSLGTAFVGHHGDPWLLEQSTDIVARLDPQQPWVVDSSWNVAMSDASDAGFASSYSDPTAVVVGAGTKAYVLRYTRNLVAVLDTSQVVDGGAPTSSIDLSSELQAAGDGYVADDRRRLRGRAEARLRRAREHQPLRRRAERLRAALRDHDADGHRDRHDERHAGRPQRRGARATAGRCVGFNPILGPGALAYDAQTGASGRLLVLDAGCNPTAGDGGVGAARQREVESIDLATGQAQPLLDLTVAAVPRGPHLHRRATTPSSRSTRRRTCGTRRRARSAPPSPTRPTRSSTTGSATSSASRALRRGRRLRGLRRRLGVACRAGTVTKLGSNPFTLTNGFVGGVSLWPAP